MERNAFGKRLKSLREENGYSSQQAFATAFGVVQSTVGNWEAGRREPNQETTIRLAAFFGVTTDYLLGIVNDPHFYSDHLRNQAELIADLRFAAGVDKERAVPAWTKVVETASRLSPEGLAKLADYAEDLDASGRYKPKQRKEVADNGIHTQEDHKDGEDLL